MKEIIKRGLIGIPMGITIGHLITIGISLSMGMKELLPCVPQLTEQLGSELTAVIVQTLLCALLGAGFGGASVIWDKENWGIVRQTGIYFLVISLLMLPIAYVTCWMEHTVMGFISYFGIFAASFTVVWTVMFFVARNNVKKLNAGLGGND